VDCKLAWKAAIALPELAHELKATNHGSRICFQKQSSILGLQKLPYINNIDIFNHVAEFISQMANN